MDTTAIESAEEALFADIMASSSSSAETRRGKLKVEKREKRRDGTKQRPVSMTTFPPSSAYCKAGPAGQSNGAGASRGGMIAGLLGRGLPFLKPKAFFSSVQHLPGRVESYNRNHEQLYQLKPLAASQVRC